jgi:NADPH-dependent FMN reductase
MTEQVLDQVGYFVGSLSSTSINRELSKALIRLTPEDLEFTEIPIGNLPLYSQDYDDNYPPEARALKEAIARSDAILFVTPEYNRSIPGALKNAIDWPRGRGARTPLYWMYASGAVICSSSRPLCLPCRECGRCFAAAQGRRSWCSPPGRGLAASPWPTPRALVLRSWIELTLGRG